MARLPHLPALLASAALLAAAPLSANAQTGGVPRALRLNDTGLSRCTLDNETFTTECAGTGQDAEFGRDALHPSAADGHAGFAFAKVCNSGELAGSGRCGASAAQGPGPDDWGCTFDRITGLTWEVKTADGGLRDAGGRYTNYGDGREGDASAFVAVVNATGLCGAADWRLPTTHELQGIENFNLARPHPSIAGQWFPNSLAAHYWNAEPYVGQEDVTAWVTSFAMDPRNISVTGETRKTANPVRLVRGGYGADMATPRFQVRGAEVADTRSHLVWQRCAVGRQWDGSGCPGLANFYSFNGALALARRVAVAAAFLHGRACDFAAGQRLPLVASELVAAMARAAEALRPRA